MRPKKLVQVAPSPKITRPPRPNQSNVKSGSGWILHIGQKFAAGYERLQVCHQRSYSIERMQAFQAYCERTSVTRAVAVCVLTPLPSLLAIVLIECIPLEDPVLGWKANYMFWIRFFVSGVMIIMGSTYQVTDMVDQMKLSPMQFLGTGVVSMSVYIAIVMVVAMIWVFPVPFGIVFGIGPCFFVLLVVLIFTIGLRTFKENPGLAHEMKLQLYVLGTQAVIAMIYPAFSTIYLQASPTERAGLMLLLPSIKLISKNIVAWACGHLEDYVPVIAVFSIEVFDAVYVATSMQATKSTLATAVIIAFDAVNGALNFRSILGRTRTIQQQWQLLFSSSEDKRHASGELVALVVATSRNLRAFRTKTGKIIRVRSPLKLGLGPEAERVLDTLMDHQKRCTSRKEPRNPSRIGSRDRGANNNENTLQAGDSVLPKPIRQHTQPFDEVTALQIRFRENQVAELVESTLQLLFQCEYHILVEYVECAIPILFGIYVTILCQLPTHAFYPHTRDMKPGQLEEMLSSISLYVALEVLSFVVMHLVLKQKFKLSALYQLSFALETHFVQMQSRLIVWIVFILQFTLQHYGVDFTFRFAWVS